MSDTLYAPAPGSNWRSKKDRKTYNVPFGAEEDGVVAVNADGCWSGPVELFVEEFEEVGK